VVTEFTDLAPGECCTDGWSWIEPRDYGLGLLFRTAISARVRNKSAVLAAWDVAKQRRVNVGGLWVGQAGTGSVEARVEIEWSGAMDVLLLAVLTALVGFLTGLRIRRKRRMNEA